LAFIGAQEGPSADLYEYYPESGEVVRLTDGPDQAYRPVWSPGGEWIVHGAAERFSRVAGFGIDVSGFYTARADGSGVFSLYDVAADSGDEAVVGWLDGQTLVARSWLYTCGPSNVRLVDLAEQQVELSFEGCISGAAVGSGTVLFSQSSNDAAFDADARLGIYRLTASDRTPRMISGENTLEIEWEEGIGAFLARPWGTRLLEVSTAGEIRELPATAYIIPTVSPNGRWWAYISEWTYHRTDGIFAGGYGTELRQIFDGEVAGNGMIFSPDGDSLYFVAKGGGLYRARAPEWAPILLATGLTPAYGWTDMAWWEE
ncbi:MAG: hypothetical protein ACK2UB_03755, partial [Anaerolineales bacterium]